MVRSYSLNPEPVRWWLAAALFALIVAFVPVPAWIVDDFYSRDMYPWLQRIMTAGTNILPFALLDLLLIAVAAGVLHRLYRLIHVTRQRGVMDALWEAFRRVVRAGAVLVVLFLWGWGFNYRRLPLESALPTAPAQPTVAALQVAFGDAAALAARLRPLVQPEGRFHSIALELRDPMNTALRSLNREPLQTFSQPKYSFVLTPFFTASGVTGMMNPLGLETIVLADLLPYERPFVVAHEWGHLSGHADEAEANAVGWLACMRGNPTAAYSASLFLITESAAAMPGAARQPLMDRLDANVRADLDAIARRMAREHPRVRQTTDRVYGEYLRANRVADGTASYGRALKLILSSPFRDALSGYTISR
jgi:hypothetical protein